MKITSKLSEDFTKVLECLELEKRHRILFELNLINDCIVKIKAEVIKTYPQNMIINTKTNEIKFEYPQETKNLLDKIDEIHCEQLLDLAKRNGIDLIKNI